MDYTYPSYFFDFQCEAGACSDTCCAGWGIAIDSKSLKKYQNYKGAFGNRLRNSIDWKEASFEQYKGRCAFLNEENLCDIYIEAGKKMLCKTCTRYPRHYEEYENLREVSLSLSCPVAARLILSTDKKMTFCNSYKETKEEEYEEFDFFLFTKLQEIREYFFEIVQNRKWSLSFRMALLLTTGHDLQNRIQQGKLYEIDELLERYKQTSFLEKAEKRFAAYNKAERKESIHPIWKKLYALEVLRSSWTAFLKKQEQHFNMEEYSKHFSDFLEYYKEEEYEYEQLLMYFLFTYFCGAVYDGDAFSKVKLAIVHTLLIQELDFSVWLEHGRSFTLEDQIEVAHSYAREVEHSDLNMNTIEHMVRGETCFTLDALLKCILSSK